MQADRKTQDIKSMDVYNWGKYPTYQGQLRRFKGDLLPVKDRPWIPRGMGRSYGDASLAPHMVSSGHWNRFLDFSASTGILSCESGVTFAELLSFFIPKGWFPPVTPGTKFVSLGGAIASDVHGKNHHKEGSLSAHVIDFDLMLPSGEIIHCSPSEHEKVYWATFGGMGLTGFVLRLRLKMKPIETAWVKVESIKASHLQEIMELTESFSDTTYSMAWIDALAKGKRMGRSILMKGEHASLAELQGSKKALHPLKLSKKRKWNVPFDFPGFVLNPLSMRLFNFAIYHKQISRKANLLMDYDSFFLSP